MTWILPWAPAPGLPPPPRPGAWRGVRATHPLGCVLHLQPQVGQQALGPPQQGDDAVGQAVRVLQRGQHRHHALGKQGRHVAALNLQRQGGGGLWVGWGAHPPSLLRPLNPELTSPRCWLHAPSRQPSPAAASA